MKSALCGIGASMLARLLLVALPVTIAMPMLAQSIIPAREDAGTGVVREGNRFNITGGSLSKDGANLFHSFQRFGLSRGEIANFLSNPNIRNILGRVVGGEASYINGLIQVTGGHSNLFLMNPAGMVFGADASLNVPAAFTATTATSIGFNSGLLKAAGNNNYAALVGTPSAFYFGVNQPGSIVNAGNLAVEPGQNLTLLGGTVLNTGSLNAPQGNITIAAVSGENVLRISQPGHLLSVEVLNKNINTPSLIPSALSLNQLLSGSSASHATGVKINSNGTVQLIGSGLQVEAGDVAISPQFSAPMNAQNMTFAASKNLTLVETQLDATGDLNLLAGDTVRVRDGATIAGKNLTIQGNKNIDILALNHPIAAFQSGGNLNLISDGNISGDAHFAAGGNFSILDLSGGAGNFVSLYDPIISSNGNVSFGDYTGVSLKVEAKGAIVGGDINITGADTTLSNSTDPDVAILRNSPALILRSRVESLKNPPNVPPNRSAEGTFFVTPPGELGENISVRVVSTTGGPAILDSPGEITLDTIATAGGDINLRGGGAVTVLGTLNSSGGNIDITTGNLLRVNGTFTNSNRIPTSISSATENTTNNTGGTITIRHGGGIETPFIVGNSDRNGTQGAILTGVNGIVPTFAVPVPPATFTQGNINIITNIPPEPEPEPTPTPTPTLRLDNLEPKVAFQAQSLTTPESGFLDPEGQATLTIRTVSDREIGGLIDVGSLPRAVLFIDRLYSEQVGEYLKQNVKREVDSYKKIQEKLQAIADATGTTPAIIYAFTRPEQLDIIVVAPQGEPIHKSVRSAGRENLMKVAKDLRNEITEPRKRNSSSYKTSAQQLYQWIIAPIEPDLQALGIDTLVFSMDAGLRALPLAALSDGNQFLVEKYAIGLIPSVNLTDTRYQSLKNSQLLAMGASQFAAQNPLPAVPIELSTITSEWKGKSFLNEGFTLGNLKSQRSGNNPFQIIHLATHAEFKSGDASNSYIQLWDSKLLLTQLRQLKLNDPLVELLVLSACRTAIGDESSELGFAGLAVQAGVKSALASLWYVSDAGTLALMSEFYQRLNTAPIKTRALQQAQIAMIRGEIRLDRDRLIAPSIDVQLPPDIGGTQDFSHPYYWAAFTMIGSPW